MIKANQQHVLTALVQSVPGVLAQISGMLASRGFNIDSLAVGETENSKLLQMTFVVFGDDLILDQVRKQLETIITVVNVDDISSRDYAECVRRYGISELSHTRRIAVVRSTSGPALDVDIEFALSA